MSLLNGLLSGVVNGVNPATNVTMTEGTDAERLALTPTTPIQFYATDSGQLYQWRTSGAGGWISIG